MLQCPSTPCSQPLFSCTNQPIHPYSSIKPHSPATSSFHQPLSCPILPCQSILLRKATLPCHFLLCLDLSQAIVPPALLCKATLPCRVQFFPDYSLPWVPCRAVMLRSHSVESSLVQLPPTFPSPTTPASLCIVGPLMLV